MYSNARLNTNGNVYSHHPNVSKNYQNLSQLHPTINIDSFKYNNTKPSSSNFTGIFFNLINLLFLNLR